MSISNEINRISGNVSDAFNAVSLKGGTVPTGATSDNLASSIQSIPTSGGNDIIWVNGLLDLQTMSVTNLDKTYQQCIDAIANDKDVKIRLKFYLSANSWEYGIGTLCVTPDPQRDDYFGYVVEWNLMLLGNFGAGEAIHYFHVKLRSDESTTTSYRVVTSSGS